MLLPYEQKHDRSQKNALICMHECDKWEIDWFHDAIYFDDNNNYKLEGTSFYIYWLICSLIIFN